MSPNDHAGDSVRRCPGGLDVTAAAGLESAGGAGVRPPPHGLSRRDRRQWRTLEVNRVQREAVAATRHTPGRRTGWQPGFIQPPPRGLGRTGRKAWLQAERESTRRWWRGRRASDTDIADRATGVLVIAVVVGIAVLIEVLTRGGDSTDTAPAGTEPVTVSTPARSSTPSPAVSAQPPGTVVDVFPDPAAAGLPAVAGRWDPAPMTGVSPVTVTPPRTVDPTTVGLEPGPVGPATEEDLATPGAAVRAWLERTCPSSWTDPFGAEQRRGKDLMTSAGWAATDPAKDPAAAAVWAGVVAARQTRVCGDLDVQISAGVPTDNGVALVGYTAHRLVTAPDTAPVVEELSGSRVVRQAGERRWFVDVPAVGG